jgi:predicted ribosome quality control (RQC) complex YloA/Tae2 family protein
MVSLAGGCLLTDPIFSERLKKLLEWHGALLADDIRLIKIGREIFDQNGIIVVGRDEKDNEKIRKNSVPSDITTTTAEVKGPLTVVRMKGVNERKTGKPEDRGKAVPDHHLLKKAAHLSIRYSRARLAEEASD